MPSSPVRMSRPRSWGSALPSPPSARHPPPTSSPCSRRVPPSSRGRSLSLPPPPHPSLWVPAETHSACPKVCVGLTPPGPAVQLSSVSALLRRQSHQLVLQDLPGESLGRFPPRDHVPGSWNGCCVPGPESVPQTSGRVGTEGTKGCPAAPVATMAPARRASENLGWES